MQHDAGTTEKPHEQLCNNCGKCCYKKIIVGRTVFITPFPCEYLDTDSNMCTIYDRREELNPLCLTVEEGLKVSAFPADCPYVEKLAPKDYRPARDDWDWKFEWDGFDELADDLDVKAETRQKVRSRGPDAQPMHIEAYAKIQARREAEAQMHWGTRIVDLRNDQVPSLAGMASPPAKGPLSLPLYVDICSVEQLTHLSGETEAGNAGERPAEG